MWLWAALLCVASGPALRPAVAHGRPDTLDLLVRPGERVTVPVAVDPGTRTCTLRVGAKSRTAVASDATEIRFSFRVARTPRLRSARVTLACTSAQLQHGVLRVRRGGRATRPLINGAIHAVAIRLKRPAKPSAPPAPAMSAWLSPAEASARAIADWAAYGDAYASVFRNGECTDWAQRRRPDIVQSATIRLWAEHLTGAPEAVANWNGGFWDDTARAAGLEVGAIPRVGAVATFDPGTQGVVAATGHVAYVESINPDGSFVVSEMNAPLPYEVSYRTIPAAAIARGGLSFVY